MRNRHAFNPAPDRSGGPAARLDHSPQPGVDHRRPGPKRPPGFHDIAGYGTAGSAIGAIALNTMAQREIDQSANIRETYAAGGSNDPYPDYAQRYDEKIRTARTLLISRNIAGGAAALAAAGITIRIIF